MGVLIGTDRHKLSRLAPRAFTPRLALVLLAALAGCGGAPRAPSSAGPLALERTIALPGVEGRIDHLALDPDGRRLFVAALGNDTVEVIDLAGAAPVVELRGQVSPQGLVWVAARNELWVASGDGQVRVYGGAPLALVRSLQVGEDADNVRLDPQTGRVVVGYGVGALAVLDPATGALVRTIDLPGHPESFRLDGDRAYVNVPDAHSIVVVSLASGAQIAAWPTAAARWNFPMALDADRKVLAVVFRLPASLRLLDAASGTVLASLGACGDADDVFFDRPRRRIYVVCGSGAVDVFAGEGRADDRPTARVATRSGARTGFFSPESDRLYVAAPAKGGQPAEVLVLRPGS